MGVGRDPQKRADRNRERGGIQIGGQGGAQSRAPESDPVRRAGRGPDKGVGRY